MSKRVVVLGAGSTGRGHVGELAFEAGWELVLADKDRALVEALQRAAAYRVSLYGAQSVRRVVVDRYRAYDVEDAAALVAESLEAPLVLTSLFSHNLAAIAPLVAEMISARHAAGVEEPLNVVCCENMQNSSAVLRSLVQPLLSPEVGAYAETHVGFPDCMISRVVPVADDPLEMPAEDYNEWTVDAGGFVGAKPDLPAMELVSNQEARLARKFFLHNGCHAIVGYWGWHRGHTYIHEAVADPVVVGHFLRAVEEIAPVVARGYGFTVESVREYGLELGPRGAVAELKDAILRVVRDPLRKLSRPERLVAPAERAVEYGLPCEELVQSMAAVLHYYRADDPQAVQMRERLEGEGAERAIAGILGLPQEHPLVAQVAETYGRWQSPG